MILRRLLRRRCWSQISAFASPCCAKYLIPSPQASSTIRPSSLPPSTPQHTRQARALGITRSRDAQAMSSTSASPTQTGLFPTPTQSSNPSQRTGTNVYYLVVSTQRFRWIAKSLVSWSLGGPTPLGSMFGLSGFPPQTPLSDRNTACHRSG